MLVDYLKLSVKQQEVFRTLNPQLAPHYAHYRVFLRKDGEVARRRGWWQWTEEFAKRTDAAARAMMRGEDVRSRGDLRDVKTATFHLCHE